MTNHSLIFAASVIDVTMLVVMRDNLATNVLMLLWPIDALGNWQAGG